MSIGAILLVMSFCRCWAPPTWPDSHVWGDASSGATGAVLIILLIPFLPGRYDVARRPQPRSGDFNVK